MGVNHVNKIVLKIRGKPSAKCYSRNWMSRYKCSSIRSNIRRFGCSVVHYIKGASLAMLSKTDDDDSVF